MVSFRAFNSNIPSFFFSDIICANPTSLETESIVLEAPVTSDLNFNQSARFFQISYCTVTDLENSIFQMEMLGQKIFDKTEGLSRRSTAIHC